MNKQIISTRHSRRHFIKYSSMAIGAAAMTGPYVVSGQNLNSRINIAQIGTGGKGKSDRQCCLMAGENVVALCDINASDMDAANQEMDKLSQRGIANAARLPEAKLYKDFRKLLETEKSIDAVDIATPDHMHAIIAETAIKMGKHVYCQKPLTHDVYEARNLRELAKKYNVATQMGNQGSASDGLRRAVEVIHSGLIGPVHEAYVWTNRPVWPQGLDRPQGSDPVPAGLDWDLWLGTAPLRPYKADWPNHAGQTVYQPFVWRGWQDFGTGALGDMACHTVNWPFRALKLGYPTEIEAAAFDGAGQPIQMNKEQYPLASRIRFEFPAREGFPPVTFHWSDGGLKPKKELTADVATMLGEVSGSGCIMVGENGMVYSGDDGDQELKFFVKLKDDKELISERNHPAVKAIPETIPRNAFGGSGPRKNPPDVRQHMEWINAIKTGKHDTAYSNFEIAAYLTEIILLGCVALRTGKTLEWDGPNMKAKNAPESAQYVRREYRDGWSS